MRTIEEIDREIAAVQAELNDLHGTETEVYARIVGYYRAVRNWNKGKRDEFDQRKMFVLNDDISDSRGKNTEAIASAADCQELFDTQAETNSSDNTVQYNKNNKNKNEIHYDFFMRKTCPNCPPVKKFIQESELTGRTIDVDTETGLKEAAGKGVFAAPTVIFYDASGQETGRAHNVEELKAVLTPMAVAV